MIDAGLISQEARGLHDVFAGLSYGLISVFLLLGIFVEYFKWPLGGVPSFASLIGRALVAIFLLQAYPEIANLISTFMDDLAQRIGDFNNIDLMLARVSDKMHEQYAGWVSVKETISMALSFLAYFILYFSVYVAQGIFLFTYMLCYVFSPILIALFVLPATASATKGLFRSLIEVGAWKVMWSAMATLVWSTALSDLNKPSANVNFISVICINLLLASSMLATPWLVHAFAGGGIAGFARNLGGVAIGAAYVTPRGLLQKSKDTLSQERQVPRPFRSAIGKRLPANKPNIKEQ